jgi:hypothetical protein
MFREMIAQPYQSNARISRTQTLDGGVVISHFGVVAGDMTLTFAVTCTEVEAAYLKTMYEHETEVSISCDHGFFTGAISSLGITEGKATITFMVKEKNS